MHHHVDTVNPSARCCRTIRTAMGVYSNTEPVPTRYPNPLATLCSTTSRSRLPSPPIVATTTAVLEAINECAAAMDGTAMDGTVIMLVSMDEENTMSVIIDVAVVAVSSSSDNAISFRSPPPRARIRTC